MHGQWFDDCNVPYEVKLAMQAQLAEQGNTYYHNKPKPTGMTWYEPDVSSIVMNAEGVESEMQYASQVATWLGDIAADEPYEVGVVEISEADLKGMDPAELEKVREAHQKEIKQMTERRFVKAGSEKAKAIAGYVDPNTLTADQKKKAQRCRLSYTQKRPDEEEVETGLDGKHKARLVAMDIKKLNPKPNEVTYAPVPSMEAIRLMIASFQHEEDIISSTDLDVAYLQSFKWKDNRLMLVCYWDFFLQEKVYEWIDGVIYGLQEGGHDWKETFCFRLCNEMGFKECLNMQSTYYQPEKKVTVAAFVDDPLSKSKGQVSLEWYHSTLEELFDTKGRKVLTPGSNIDYLSMTLALHDNGDLTLDNEIKIDKYLDEKGLTDCNPAKMPIDRTILKMLGQNIKDGKIMCGDAADQIGTGLGEIQWLAQTTHPVLAPAASIYASVLNKRPVGSDEAIKKVFRFLKGIKGRCLIKRAGNREGFVWSSDSDWGGLYALIDELRSRSGVYGTYDGFPVFWKSCYQQCRGTEFDPMSPYTDDGSNSIISTSSAEAETHAASEALKLALHGNYVAEEIGLPVDSMVHINIDAGAALGFINNTASVGRMKHIDMRDGWVQQLRDHSKVKFHKIAGTDNDADFFTKVLPIPAFEKAMCKMMPFK